MTSTELLQILLDNMQQEWESVERIQSHLRKVEWARDEETLLAYSTDLEFKYRRKEFEESEERIVGDLKSLHSSPTLNTPEQRCHRFLTRSAGNFDALILNYKELLSVHSELVETYDHYKGVKRHVNKLVYARLPKLRPRAWNCNSGELSRNQCWDHIHTVDKQMWPTTERELEKRLPLASSPVIEWRNFECFISEGHPSEGLSLYGAFERSLALHGSRKIVSNELTNELSFNVLDKPNKTNEQLFMDTLAKSGTLARINAMLRQRQYIEALATTCHELNKFLTPRNPYHKLAVILPGGSQVFYPSVYPNDEEGPTYGNVKMSWKLSDKLNQFRFYPVTVGKSNSRRENTQTIPFENLPAEVRNMIYGLVLDEGSATMMPRRQPALALTCQVVNREMMSLFFARFRWVVKM